MYRELRRRVGVVKGYNPYRIIIIMKPRWDETHEREKPSENAPGAAEVQAGCTVYRVQRCAGNLPSGRMNGRDQTPRNLEIINRVNIKHPTTSIPYINKDAFYDIQFAACLPADSTDTVADAFPFWSMPLIA